jgi:twinkle protein
MAHRAAAIAQGGRMKLAQGIATIEDGDYDWLLEMGRERGKSRVVQISDASVQGLVDCIRGPQLGGLKLPWAAAVDRNDQPLVQFVPGKVTVWSGPTFSGKTQFLRQLMLHAINKRERIFFASLEEEALDVIREFVFMAGHHRKPTSAFVRWCLDWWEDYLFVLDSVDITDPTLVLGAARWLAAEVNIKHVVIDSLMRMSLRIDDYEGQRELGNTLSRIARLSQAHIHIVAHPRKTQSSRAAMDLYDIRGAGDIVAQADNIITLERNHDESKDYSNVMTVWKQRGDINWIGAMRLYYHTASRQLLWDKHDKPMRFLPGEAYPEEQPQELF